MGKANELNPVPWHDGEQGQRRPVPQPMSNVAVALRASFEVKPLPADMARLLERLR